MKEPLPYYILETNMYCIDAETEDLGIRQDPILVPMTVDLRSVSAIRLADEDDVPPKGGTVLFGAVAGEFSIIIEDPYEEVKAKWLSVLEEYEKTKH